MRKTFSVPLIVGLVIIVVLTLRTQLIDFSKECLGKLIDFSLNRILSVNKNISKATRDNDNAQAHYNLASSYYYKAMDNKGKGEVDKYLENLDLAKKEYEKTIEIDSNFALAYMSLGSIYFEKEDFLKAEKLFKKGINIDPSCYEIRFNLAYLYRTMNMNEKALANYREGLKVLEGQNSREYAHRKEDIERIISELEKKIEK